MTRRMMVAGNWKMNAAAAGLAELDTLIAAGPSAAEVVLCPPATLIAAFAARARGSHVAIGGQDCHPELSGAHTGDISAPMLADAGASHVIVGHSERRADHGETDALVRAKASAALAAGLVPIVCVGEIEAERDAGRALEVVAGQLDASLPDDIGGTVVAYEPVWAIGTGRVPAAEDIAGMHDALRARLTERFGETGIRLLYGGSVKAANAAEIFALRNVDGGLVGGASLKAKDFLPIVEAAT